MRSEKRTTKLSFIYVSVHEYCWRLKLSCVAGGVFDNNQILWYHTVDWMLSINNNDTTLSSNHHIRSFLWSFLNYNWTKTEVSCRCFFLLFFPLFCADKVQSLVERRRSMYSEICAPSQLYIIWWLFFFLLNKTMSYTQ